MRRCLALLLALFPLVASADKPPPARVVAVRIDRPPAIDGKLDDEAWTKAPVATGFRQEAPSDGAKVTEETEFWITYDDKNLYVAVRNHDSNPAGIISRLTRRDRDIQADWTCLFIDSRDDRNTAWFFQLSPAGVKVDGQQWNDTNTSYDWDGVWDGEVSTDAGGWNAEFAIPFTALRFEEKDVNRFGFQVIRNVSRKRETSKWAYAPRNSQGFVSLFGYIDGITKVKPRRVFELRPYLLARAGVSTPEGGGFFGQTGEDVDADLDADVEVGLDLKLGLTSELTLDATINPDFGQVEADQVVLNLTRFETFFPEKRPFFLEGRELYETPLQLVYPRRIGRPATGLARGSRFGDETVVDAEGALRIWGATKVTGTIVPKVNLAVLAAVTGAEQVALVDDDGMRRETELAPERLYAAFRTRYAPAEGAFIGATATAVTRLGGTIQNARADHDAYTQAVDGWLQGSGRWRLTGQIALSERVGGAEGQAPGGLPCEMTDPACRPIVRADGTQLSPGDVGWGSKVFFEYSVPKLFTRLDLRALSPTFDVNDIGFLPQWGRHDLIAVVGFREPHGSGIFHNWAVIPYFDGTLDYEGKPSAGFVGVDMEAELKGFVFTSPDIGIFLPGTYDPLETFDGAYFENKPNVTSSWHTNTNQAAMVSGFVNLFYKHDLGGRGWRFAAETGVSLQAASNLELAIEPSFGIESNQKRFFGCAAMSGEPCVFDEGERRYTFADLDSRFFSATFRGTYTLTTNFSIQGYAQLFLADGEFDRFGTVDTTGRRPTIEREDLVPAPGEQTDDGNFESASLNVNLVARWEPLRGSTLFFVYTRSQESPFSRLGQLGRGPTVDVVLLKFVYFWERA
jgi:Domain of unknown function (DUF5916)/Carbohydrate family 9 binding domain-like